MGPAGERLATLPFDLGEIGEARRSPAVSCWVNIFYLVRKKKGSMKLRLRKFNPAGEGGDGIFKCFVVLIGKRNSGKTTLLRALLEEIKDKIDLVVGFSPTDDCNSALSDMIPSTLVHREVSEAVLRNLVDVQRDQWKNGRKGYEVALILDDCAHERKLFDSKIFKELAFNSRHLHLTVIMTMQYAVALGPAVRGNCDVVITLAERMVGNRKRLYESFFGMTSYQEFAAIMDKCTENYEALVLWNKAKSNNLSDSMFWYKADLTKMPSQGRISSDWSWELHNHFNVDGKVSAEHPAGTPIDGVVQADEDDRTVAKHRVVDLSPVQTSIVEEATDLQSDAFRFE